jgi:tetrahydromethanopterin S-methyltransferase subunit G
MDRELLEAIGQIMDQKLTPVHKRLDALEETVVKLEDAVTWMRGSMFRMETEHLPKISAALAAMDDNRHRLDGHEQRIETAEDEIGRHADRIAVLELART